MQHLVTYGYHVVEEHFRRRGDQLLRYGLPTYSCPQGHFRAESGAEKRVEELSDSRLTQGYRLDEEGRLVRGESEVIRFRIEPVEIAREPVAA